jgi:hypothetical protein
LPDARDEYGKVDTALIDRSIAAYEVALDEDPESLEASWKLLRSLHYRVEFTNASEAESAAVVEKTIEIAERSAREAEAIEGRSPARARIYFWSAIAWASRAQRAGVFSFVRDDVAGRVRAYTEKALGLDPGVDEGGAQRLLSRLHATLPRVPLVTGWVDRGLVLPFAEAAHAAAPSHPGNELVLALALLEIGGARTEDARAKLESLARSSPREAYWAEDQSIQREAIRSLAAIDR